MSLSITDDFRKALDAAARYPCNLRGQQLHPATLRSYQTRLHSAIDALCIQDETQTSVPVLEFGPTWKGDLTSPQALNQCLGIRHPADAADHQNTAWDLSRQDPVTRYIFLHAYDGRSALRIPRGMLLQLLSYHQVTPAILDFLLLFGERSRATDLRYSGFREQVFSSAELSPHNLPPLNRSGKQYELCYNLKAVAEKRTAANLQNALWTIRQAAVYHKFDVVKGTSLWIITRGALDLKHRVEEACGPAARFEGENATGDHMGTTFRSSLSTHVVAAQWASEQWRWYLRYLEELVESNTREAKNFSRDPTRARKVFLPEDLQAVQRDIDSINQAANILETNGEVLAAICKFYDGLSSNSDCPLPSSSGQHIANLTSQLNNIADDMKMQKSRAVLLAQQALAGRDLIMEHLHSQNTERIERLTDSAYAVARAAQRDAIAMRIITVVALVYLPATFVSSFFSTDVVKYQDQNNFPTGEDQSYSPTALHRWFQVTVPLTFVTLALAWLWYKRAERKQRALYDYDDPEKAVSSAPTVGANEKQAFNISTASSKSPDPISTAKFDFAGIRGLLNLRISS